MTNCYIFSVSEAPKEPAAAKKFVSYDPKYKTDQQKKEEVRISWIKKMHTFMDTPVTSFSLKSAFL